MNRTALAGTVALGALTGMRSMAGAATLAWQHTGGTLARVAALMAAGEMIADKTSIVGDRIDPLPLAGRALMGAVVGAVVTRQAHGNMAAGALIGGATAVVTARLAYLLRTRLPLSNELAGLVEDAVVMALSAAYASTADARRPALGHG